MTDEKKNAIVGAAALLVIGLVVAGGAILALVNNLR